MSEPNEYVLVQDLHERLKTIAQRNGHHYDVAGTAVKLDPDHEVDDLIPSGDRPGLTPRPFILLDLSARHEFDYSEKGSVGVRVPYEIYWVHDTELVDEASKVRTYFRGLADVEAAIASDIVQIAGRRMEDGGGSEIRAIVDGQITTRRLYGVPNVA